MMLTETVLATLSRFTPDTILQVSEFFKGSDRYRALDRLRRCCIILQRYDLIEDIQDSDSGPRLYVITPRGLAVRDKVHILRLSSIRLTTK